METASAGTFATLSERERAVATRYAEGLTYREIGRALSIAPATVRTHLAAVYEKLGVHNKTALIRLTVMPTVERHPVGTPPVIAVLPFRVAADHPRWERLGDGLTHDVITDLGRHSGLWVIAAHTMLGYRTRDVAVGTLRRELGARYVVSGSLQAGDGRIRVRADLSDAATGMQLWAERYDEPEGEVFAIQDEIARRIVNALAGWSGGVARAGLEVARRKVPSSLEAYDLYLLAAEQKHQFTRESLGEAIRLMSRAVAIDPGFAAAWTCLGLAHACTTAYGFCEDRAAANAQWRACTERALALDPDDAKARVSMGDRRAIDGDLVGAAEEYRRALASAPHDADVLAFLAASLALVAGAPDEGVALGRRALRLNPGAPPWYYGTIGRAAYVAGDDRDSAALLRRAPASAPVTLMFLAMAQARMGEAEAARDLAAGLALTAPGFTVEGFIRDYPVTSPPALAAIREGAAEAGLR